MHKTKLFWVAAFVGILVCVCAAGGVPAAFSKGVQQSDTCTKNDPDHFMCRMFGGN